MRNWKMGLFLVLLLPTLCSGEGTSEKPHWKTFKSNVGFSFEYPAGWQVSAEDDISPEDAESISILGPEHPSYPSYRTGAVQMGWYTKSASGAQDVEMMARTYKGKIKGGECVLGREKGREIVTYNELFLKAHVLRHCVVKHHDKYFSFSYSEYDTIGDGIRSDLDWKYRDVEERILSSIKFSK